MRWINRFAEFFDDWSVMIRRNGTAALPVIAQEVVRLPYRHLKFFVLERSLIEPIPEMPPRIPLEIRPFSAEDVAFVREIDRPSEARLCARRLEAGHRGLMALSQGKPAGYAWGCAEVNPHLERVHLDLAPGDVLCTDVYTNPAFRGQGVQTALSLARFRLFRNLGFQNAVCYIEVRNAPSLAVWQRKLGARVVGTIDFLRIGAWYRVETKPAASSHAPAAAPLA